MTDSPALSFKRTDTVGEFTPIDSTRIVRERQIRPEAS